MVYVSLRSNSVLSDRVFASGTYVKPWMWRPIEATSGELGLSLGEQHFLVIDGLKGGCSPSFKAVSQSMLASQGLALTSAADFSLMSRSGVSSCRTRLEASSECTNSKRNRPSMIS